MAGSEAISAEEPAVRLWLTPSLVGAALIWVGAFLRIDQNPWAAIDHAAYLTFCAACLSPWLWQRRRRSSLWMFAGSFFCAYAVVAEAITPFCPTQTFAAGRNTIRVGMTEQQALTAMGNRRYDRLEHVLLPTPCTGDRHRFDMDYSWPDETDSSAIKCPDDGYADVMVHFEPGVGDTAIFGGTQKLELYFCRGRVVLVANYFDRDGS